MLKRGLLAGGANLLLSFGISWLQGMAMPSLAREYQNTAVFRPWNDPLMMVYFAYPFVLGVVLAYLWDKVKAKDAVEFAKFYFVIATIPGMFISYTSFQISALMISMWILTGFLQAWVSGLVFTKIKS